MNRETRGHSPKRAVRISRRVIRDSEIKRHITGMRVDEVRSSIPLNIATILIGSTILGATENDQIHFFYHFQEGRWTGTTSGALRHALLIAGRPIVFATFINVSGFLALALSDLPPMREFGIVSSSAFVLALLADFTALPAALWILSRYDRRNAA